MAKFSVGQSLHAKGYCAFKLDELKICNVFQIAIQDGTKVQEGDLFGWTSHGDSEITLQYLHANICSQ